MEFSHNEIYTSLVSLLARSETFEVWYEPHDNHGGVGFSFGGGPLIHAVLVETNEHFIVNIVADKIRVDRYHEDLGYPGETNKPFMLLELSDPNSIIELETFFDVKSMDAPAKPANPIAAISALIRG